MSTSYQSRLASATKILQAYIEKVSKEDPESYLNAMLARLGIDDSDIGIQTLDAESTTFEDFKDVFKQLGFTSEIPEPRLKLAWAALKGPKEKSSDPVSGTPNLTSLIQTMRPIGQWSDLELLEKYGKDCPLEIEEELKKRSKDRNCIIFFDDGTVDVESSLYIFRKARYVETPSTFKIKEEIKQVFKVSQFPLEILFECPIHKNVLLVDGYCEECGISYNTQETDRLALLRLIRENSGTPTEIYRLYNFDRLSKEFAKIYILFKQLKQEDRLPSLKRRLSKVKDGDPFRVSTHRTY
jgi:hypothetical protein